MTKTKQKKTKKLRVTRRNWRWARGKVLAQLAAFMKRGYRTAADVADEMGVSFMVARKRMTMLGEDWVFETKSVREGERGPASVAYRILKRRPPRVVRRTVAAKKTRARSG